MNRFFSATPTNTPINLLFLTIIFHFQIFLMRADSSGSMFGSCCMFKSTIPSKSPRKILPAPPAACSRLCWWIPADEGDSSFVYSMFSPHLNLCCFPEQSPCLGPVFLVAESPQSGAAAAGRWMWTLIRPCPAAVIRTR